MVRHRKTHYEEMSTKTKIVDDSILRKDKEAQLQRERELLIETFSSFYEQIGEEQATAAMRNNKKLKEHMVPLRKIMEADIAERLADAQESGSIVERQLSDFKNAIPKDAREHLATFKAVINLIKKATPESIVYLKLFSKAVSSLTSHMENYSEAVNPKFRQARALKIVLDELFTEAMDELAPNVSPNDGGKRKAEELAAAASHEVPVSATFNDSEPVTINIPIPGNGNGSAKKKKKSGFGFLDKFLSGGEDEEDLLNFDDAADKDR